MKIKDIIPNFDALKPNELYEILESNADKINTSDEFTRLLSEAEIKGKNQQIGANRVEIYKVEVKKKNAEEKFKKLMKPFKDENKVLMNEVRDGYVHEQGTVFQFNDEDTEMAYFFNSKGDSVRSRPLRPNERQRTIFTTMRGDSDGVTGTNG